MSQSSEQEKRPAADVAEKRQEVLPKQDTLPATEKSAQADRDAVPETSEPSKPRSFLSRLVPENKKGKIVFAGLVAQVASMTVAPLAVILLEKISGSQLKQVNEHLGNVFEKYFDRIEPVIRKPWEGSMIRPELEEWRKADVHTKAHQFAESVTNIALQGIFNLGVTFATRKVLDKKLDIHAGDVLIAKSQALDTAVATGAMLAIPTLLPEQAREARSYLVGKMNKWPAVEKWGGKNAARHYALNVVNFSAPDLVGFGTGMAYMMREVDKKEKAEKEEPSLTR